MYRSFYDEVEKIAFQAAQKGEGSRGGKVIGRTKSGKPIYESSKKDKKPGSVSPAPTAAAPKKDKPDWGRRIAIGGAVLGTLGLAAMGFRKKKQFDKFKAAAKKYGKAGGPDAGKEGKAAWDDFAKAGDDFFGGHSEWKKAKSSYQKGYEARRAHQKASDAYNKAGGPYARGKGAEWKEYKRTGDAYYSQRPYGAGRDPNVSENYRARESAWRSGSGREHAEHEAFKRGKGGWSSAKQRASSASGAKAYSAIPGLGKVKTKKDAQKAYRDAAMKAHPDKGGNEETMKNINAAWGDFKNSPLYEKLAMVYWSRMADTLLR